MKATLVEVIRLFLITLFVYTAVNKLLTLEKFVSGLSRFPLLGSYSRIIGISVPIIELTIVIFLIIPRINKYGLWFSLLLMGLFTGYLLIMLLGDHQLPCSCGGIISQLSWKQHLYFNIATIGLIIWGIFNSKIKNN